MVAYSTCDCDYYFWNFGNINDRFACQFVHLYVVVKMRVRKKPQLIQIFSPHFDDAILSCGEHILEWLAAGNEVKVYTIFTKFAAKVYSRDSLEFMAKGKVKDGIAFRRQRSAEDKAAMRKIGITKYRWLDEVDGGFREENGQPVYRSHAALFSGHILDNSKWQEHLRTSLAAVIDPQAVVVLPGGVGYHADHLLVEHFLSELVPASRIVRYVDVPYVFQFGNWRSSVLGDFLRKPRSIKWSTKEKLKSVAEYSSQTPILFPAGVWEFPEILIGNGLQQLKTPKK
jgi:LmbE family N-acetylglucosaminyl deacetylase